MEKKAMTKLMASESHFELVTADDLPTAKIVQIYPENMFSKIDSEGCFLCEVVDDEEGRK